MVPPPKRPEGRVTILDERDVDQALRRVDELYLFLVDLLAVNRRFLLRFRSRSADNVLPLHSRYPQGRSPDERGRP